MLLIRRALADLRHRPVGARHSVCFLLPRGRDDAGPPGAAGQLNERLAGRIDLPASCSCCISSSCLWGIWGIYC